MSELYIPDGHESLNVDQCHYYDLRSKRHKLGSFVNEFVDLFEGDVLDEGNHLALGVDKAASFPWCKCRSADQLLLF